MAKNATTGVNGGGAAADRKIKAAEAEAARIVDEARVDAARLLTEAEAALREADEARAGARTELAEAEQRARGLLLDARATAEGVRAEGMDVVSNLRQIGDALRGHAERLLADVDSIHSRMISQLESVGISIDEANAGVRDDATNPLDGDAKPQTTRSDPTPGDSAGAAPADEELDVPDFVARR